MLRFHPKTERHRPSIRGWWAYFGSFGDDIFGDDIFGDDLPEDEYFADDIERDRAS